MRRFANGALLLMITLIMVSLVACSSTSGTAPNGQGKESGTSGSNQAAPQETAGGAKSVAPVKVGMSFISWSAFQWPDYVAVEKGYFAEQGIEVEQINTKSNNEIVQLMLGGDAPFTTGCSTDGMILAIQKGAKIKGLMGKAIAAPYDLVVSSDITKFDQLKGKKFGVSHLESASTIMLKVALQANGLNDKDYQLLEVGGTNARYSAIKQGGVQGTMLNPPSNFKAQTDGLNVLDSFTKYVPYYDFVSVAVEEKYAQANPQVVEGFVAAMAKALDWLAEPANRDEAEAILVKTLKLDEETAKKSYQYFVVDNHAFSANGDPHPKAFQETIREMELLGLLEKSMTLEEYYDLSYLDKAKQQLGI